MKNKKKFNGLNKDILQKNTIEPIAEYREGKLGKLGYFTIKKTLGPIVRRLWVEEVEGLYNIPPKGPVIIASNHQSYFDFICFTAISPRKIHYLAAEKFYESKLWRPLMNLTSQIKVDRSSRDKSEVYQLVNSALNQKRMIGIFPEGTRSPDGEIKRSFTGVAKFALKNKVPVIPVGIIGTYEIMSRYDRFPRLRKARIRIGEPMSFNEYYEKKPTEKDFRLVTDQIMIKIADLVGKEYKLN